MSEKYELSRLRTAAQAACEKAIAKRGDFDNAAVNWADFGCSSAEKWEDDSGAVGYRVIIEEADPLNREVVAFITAELATYGYEGIDIALEW